MGNTEDKPTKPSVRRRATAIKPFRAKHCVVVLENPNEIKNIGAVIRNVNAFGATSLYVVDPHHKLPEDWEEARKRKSLKKTSVSAVQWTYIKRFDTTAACIAHLKKRGYKSLATSPHVQGKPCHFLHEADFTQYARVALWFGNEGRGLSTEAIEHATACIAIPMFGIVESLNLGTSTGIVLCEATRQRRAYQSLFKRAGRQKRRKEKLPTEMPIEESFGRET